MKCAYLYRVDLGNPGDMWSSPHHYLHANWAGPLIDVHYAHSLDMSVDTVFVGGGAILTSASMINNIRNVLDNVKYKNLVIWGASKAKNLADDIVDKATTWGLRDWNQDGNNDHWLPCVSCLHPRLLELRKTAATRDFLVINHWKRAEVNLPIEFTSIKNKPSTIDTVLEAIAAHRFIITSSYHAAYWGILMNRRVIIVSSPWQGKLETFKWTVPQSTKFSWELLDSSVNYPDAFGEAVTTNRSFMNQVDTIASP